MPSKERSRAYCFTLNNYTDDTLYGLTALYYDSDCSYLILGFEIGDSGTPHIQGYVYFKTQIPFSTIKKIIPHCHIEKAKGKPAEGIQYCMKDGEFWEFGTIPIQGKRTDLTILVERAKSGWSDLELCEANKNQYLYHYRGLTHVRKLYEQERTKVLDVSFILFNENEIGSVYQFVKTLEPRSYIHAKLNETDLGFIFEKYYSNDYDFVFQIYPKGWASDHYEIVYAGTNPSLFSEFIKEYHYNKLHYPNGNVPISDPLDLC